MFELIARFFRWIKSWFSRVESETETVAEDVEDLAFTESEKLKESTEKFVDSVIAFEAPVSEPAILTSVVADPGRNSCEPVAAPDAPAAEAPVSEAVVPVETSVPVEAPAATTVTDPVDTTTSAGKPVEPATTTVSAA